MTIVFVHGFFIDEVSKMQQLNRLTGERRADFQRYMEAFMP